mgnify:CR=1 FL=1
MVEGMYIEKWDRFFALYENGELLCVTVYKKGALAGRDRIEELKRLIGAGEHDAEGFIPRDAE